MNESQRQFVLSLLAYTAQRGILIGQLGKLSNISPQAIRSGSSFLNDDFALERIWHNASHLCKDNLIGLHFGESLQLGALGVVGEIIQKSRTVGEALSVAVSLTGLITDQFMMEVKKSSKTFAISLVPTDNARVSSFIFLQMRDFLMVFTMHELDGLLLQRIKPISVAYPTTGSTLPEYERVFRCRPKNKGSYCVLEFDINLWNEPIITANYELHKALLNKLMADKKINFRTSGNLKERISKYLTTNSYLGIHSLEEVAANFSMSRRSIQRRLHSEGVNFQELADGVRKTLALHYIKSRSYQIKEISSILGYKEISAFSRAFKRWTGNTPKSYQE